MLVPFRSSVEGVYMCLHVSVREKEVRRDMHGAKQVLPLDAHSTATLAQLLFA